MGLDREEEESGALPHKKCDQVRWKWTVLQDIFKRWLFLLSSQLSCWKVFFVHSTEAMKKQSVCNMMILPIHIVSKLCRITFCCIRARIVWCPSEVLVMLGCLWPSAPFKIFYFVNLLWLDVCGIWTVSGNLQLSWREKKSSVQKKANIH